MVPIDKNKEHGDWAALDHWLEDSGRRKHSADWVASLYAGAPSPASAAPTQRPRRPKTALLSLFAMATLAYEMYYFIEVEIAIASLRRVIVFIALK